MKNIYRIIMAAIIAMTFASCDEKPVDPPTPEEPETPALNENLAFTLEVLEVTYESAKISVKHNGEADDTWYGFYTTETNVDKAITDKIADLTASGKVSGLKKDNDLTVTINRLEAETDYTYVVFGLSSEGVKYGKTASVEFATERDPNKFEENSAWTVTYTGSGQINGTSYDHTITVKSTDKNKYFITGVPAEGFDPANLKSVAEEELDYLKDFISEYNAAYGTNFTLDDLLFEGDGVDALLLDAGEWIALAIGVDADGNLSGLYAKSDVIKVVEEELDPAYAAWIGAWTFTGANGLTQDVVFSKGKANKTFVMSGYEGEYAAGLEVIVDWLPEDGLWVIYNQNLGSFEFESGPGDIWFVGMTAEGNLYLSEVPVCVGGAAEDGSMIAMGYEETWENEDGTQGSYKVDSMLFLAVIGESLSYISPTFQTGYPTFPFTITPAAGTAAAPAASVEKAPKSVQSFSTTPHDYHVFGNPFTL